MKIDNANSKAFGILLLVVQAMLLTYAMTLIVPAFRPVFAKIWSMSGQLGGIMTSNSSLVRKRSDRESSDAQMVHNFVSNPESHVDDNNNPSSSSDGSRPSTVAKARITSMRYDAMPSDMAMKSPCDQLDSNFGCETSTQDQHSRESQCDQMNDGSDSQEYPLQDQEDDAHPSSFGGEEAVRQLNHSRKAAPNAIASSSLTRRQSQMMADSSGTELDACLGLDGYIQNPLWNQA
eukprot:gene2188-2894_t